MDGRPLTSINLKLSELLAQAKDCRHERHDHGLHSLSRWIAISVEHLPALLRPSKILIVERNTRPRPCVGPVSLLLKSAKSLDQKKAPGGEAPGAKSSEGKLKMASLSCGG
jgi:hypothetical protein